jgi:hypothetical protein
MGILRTKTIEPATGSTLTLGASGDTVTVSSDSIKANTFKDAGGNTLFTSDGAGTLSSVNSAFVPDGPILISTHTASDSSSIDITSGIDSTYDEYMFVYTDINPATDKTHFSFQVNATDSTGYDRTITTTVFQAHHNEADSTTSLAYNPGHDQAQGAAFQILAGYVGNESDESAAGILHLFSPSSTTYVKHFYATTNLFNGDSTRTNHTFAAGYINDTTAIDEISFKMSSGNFDGTIQMYGIK